MSNNIKSIIPFESGVAITPHDTTTFPPTRGVVVGVSGNLNVTMANGIDVVWPALAAGVAHPISCIRVYATNTTATTIVVGR